MNARLESGLGGVIGRFAVKFRRRRAEPGAGAAPPHPRERRVNGMGPRRVRRWRPVAGCPGLWPRARGRHRGSYELAQLTVMVPSSRRLQDAELSELGEPARRVALDHERLVVDLGVTVGLSVAQHCEDGSRQLVGGGDDGAFVAPANDECLVVGVELPVSGARGAVGAADEHRAQVLGAGSGAGFVFMDMLKAQSRSQFPRTLEECAGHCSVRKH